MTELVSPRLVLPLLAAGQAQKEITHNEALIRLDALVGAVIEDAVTATPPSAPAPGAMWLVATGGNGAWSGEDGRIAIASSGGWRFVVPYEGLVLWDRASATQRRFHDNMWLEPNNLPLPSGGTIVDAEARAAIANIAALLEKWGLAA